MYAYSYNEFEQERTNVGYRSEKTNKLVLNICYLS